jgi:hypothetical protein
LVVRQSVGEDITLEVYRHAHHRHCEVVQRRQRPPSAASRPKTVTADLSLGLQDPGAPDAPTITGAEFIGRAALIHAAIDEYEMKAVDEHAMRKRGEDRARAT